MPDGKGIVMRLETDRLIIDHFTGSDVSMWAEIEADPDVRRFVDGQCLSREQASQYVQMNMDSYLETASGASQHDPGHQAACLACVDSCLRKRR